MSERGRPEFKVTRKMRDEVALMIACGMKLADVGRAIGCSETTLHKYFAEEISTGRAKKRLEILGWLQKAAKDGNVSAQRKLEEISRVAGAAQEFEQSTGMEAKPERLGKKAAAAEAAKHVGGEGSEWGDDLRVPLN